MASKPMQQFNAEIRYLLTTNGPKFRSLQSFIRRTLRQFHLEGRITTDEIFNMAYMRGVDHLLDPSSKAIRKPIAWMRKTSLNIIREKSRAYSKESACEEDRLEDSDNCDNINIDFSENIFAIQQAFSQLRSEDRKILQLRFFENRSWKDVHEKLGDESITVESLRKRGQRALENLRAAYHEIKPPENASHN